MSSTTTTQAAPVVRRVRVRDLPVEQQRAIRARQLRRAGTYVLAITIAVWIMLPIWLVGTLAFSTPADVRAYPKQAAPIPFSTDTMEFFLNARGVLPATRNSIVVALLTLTLSTAIAAPAGYAVARYFFRGRDAYRLGILAVRAFPIVILAVPLAVTFRNWGIFDRVYSVALMHTALTLPTTILVVSSVFASVPRELEEAAKVFGCNAFEAFLRVVMPLALPGIAASAIFTFVMSWNEVFAAVVLTLENRTLPALILYNLDKSGDPFKFAGGFFMLVPSLIFIFFMRRYLFNMWGQITK
ncbi:MAG: carbohydrate ABC transporter permease [Anaerolineae bacterium]|nr:carbohydrate ABC transporter permease [Anaerolineae bacterium]